jgi:RNA polymerase sigma factor (sigma-70 family)
LRSKVQQHTSADAHDRGLIMRWVNQRDDAAFEELWLRHFRKLSGIAVRQRVPLDDISDVMQATAIRMMNKLHTFQGGGKYSSWLYRVHCNECRMWNRKRHQKNNATICNAFDISELIKEPAMPDMHAQRCATDGLRMVEQLATRLPDTYFEMWHAVDVLGYQPTQVARKLGITSPAAKSRLNRARRLLLMHINADDYVIWAAG